MEKIALVCFVLGMVGVVHATCKTAETTAMDACIANFLSAHKLQFASIANQPGCRMSNTVDCTQYDIGVRCVNFLPLSTTCKLTLQDRFANLMARYNLDCTVTHFARYCPAAATLDTGVNAKNPLGARFETCKTAETTAIDACIANFLSAHKLQFAFIANQPGCRMSNTVDCTQYDIGVRCVNFLPLSTTCKLTLQDRFANLMARYNLDCTVTHFARYCPAAATLDTGNPSSRPEYTKRVEAREAARKIGQIISEEEETHTD